ncbi:hypothetical protein T11_4358, partial [Trichinella zimbabwensis]
MIAIESDCLWSHYERVRSLMQIFMLIFQTALFFHFQFLVFWNVQAADTVVLLMSMLIHCNVWSLLSRHPARSSFYEGLSQQSQRNGCCVAESVILGGYYQVKGRYMSCGSGEHEISGEYTSCGPGKPTSRGSGKYEVRVPAADQ